MIGTNPDMVMEERHSQHCLDYNWYGSHKNVRSFTLMASGDGNATLCAIDGYRYRHGYRYDGRKWVQWA